MAGVQIGWTMIGLALGLMLLGFPVAVTMFIAGFLGMWLLRGWVPVLSVFSYMPWTQGVNIILVVIPLYIWFQCHLRKPHCLRINHEQGLFSTVAKTQIR
jgi:TRAP-type mannitol/chloroaromatic compound transport system permease large subunit